jgi:hypothetical protein
MAFSRQQHIALLRGGLDFVPESDFRYLPINVRLKLAELEKRNGQVYLPKDEVASLKREIAAEKMSEAAKRNDPDASEYFGKDPEYKPNPVTSDPAELRGRLGTDKYGTRPTIYRTVDENSAVFNRRYNPTGLDYDSQYSGSPQTILGRYTPTIRGDEILISPTADKDDPLADKKNETEPHEYMHRGLIPTNPIRRYLLGTIDGATEALGIGNIFGTKAFPFNQHTYIDEVFEREAEKKEQAKIEKQKKLIEEIKQKYGDKKRITRVAKAKGDEVQSLINEIGIQPIEKEVRNDLRVDGTKKSQIGWKGRIVSNVTGKIHTELTIDDKYPLINPYTTEEQIEHLKNNNYEGNAQKLQETEIGREMLLNARRHYEESLQKGVSPFVTDDELQQQKLGLEKKANGGEVSYLQSALDMLTQSAPVTEAPPGTFDLGTIEPFNPIMERYKPNPIDKFAMNILDPRKKLTVITTPNKMLLKPLFAKRNKLKELIKKQEQNYKRGQDLSSKYDPKDSAQGNYMMNAAIKSGKRFQRQLNELEEKIRKIYQSK